MMTQYCFEMSYQGRIGGRLDLVDNPVGAPRTDDDNDDDEADDQQWHLVSANPDKLFHC